MINYTLSEYNSNTANAYITIKRLEWLDSIKSTVLVQQLKVWNKSYDGVQCFLIDTFPKESLTLKQIDHKNFYAIYQNEVFIHGFPYTDVEFRKTVVLDIHKTTNARTKQFIETLYKRYIMNFSNNYSTESYLETQLVTWISNRSDQTILTEVVTINATPKQFDVWVANNIKQKKRIVSARINQNNGFHFIEMEHMFIRVKQSGVMLDINFSYSLELGKNLVNSFIEQMTTVFEANPCYINFVYDPQYLESMTLPVTTQHLPVQEMYPWLKQPLTEFYDDFVESNANILILSGLPGTCKTTFVRGLLHHTKKSATVAYDAKIINQDSLFADWLSSDIPFMVLEDADNLITPRSDGNDQMSKFLNIGDGLVSMKHKKIIFSTNLPNLSDIDSALMRNGRCFDVLEFGALTIPEATALAKRLNITEFNPAEQTKKCLTASEVFTNNKQVHNTKKSLRRIGFT